MTLPLQCSLDRDELRARQADLLPGLIRRASSGAFLADGLRLRFAAQPDLLPDIARTIELERRCCRFLNFTIDIEPGEGGITLVVNGPVGTGEYLAHLMKQTGAPTTFGGHPPAPAG
jgi:hypothetical protein